MRVAALYDVHGNLPALEAVLEEIERGGVDVVVSGGDLVSGPMGRGCLERLLAVGAIFVRGNADREVPELADLVAQWVLTVELDVEDLGPDVELRRTEYDIEAAVRVLEATGYAGAPDHIGWLLDPPDPDETSEYFESQVGA